MFFFLFQFQLKTKLLTTASTYALWLYAHDNLYLILAKEKMEVTRNHTKVDVFNEPLEIYLLDEDELVLNHIVNIKGIRFIESFTLAGNINNYPFKYVFVFFGEKTLILYIKEDALA